MIIKTTADNLNVSKRKVTDIFLNITRIIDARVKTQAKVENEKSRASKLGIVCLYSLNNFGDIIEYVKK